LPDIRRPDEAQSGQSTIRLRGIWDFLKIPQKTARNTTSFFIVSLLFTIKTDAKIHNLPNPFYLNKESIFNSFLLGLLFTLRINWKNENAAQLHAAPRGVTIYYNV
jgi:hypothetical protein